MGVGEGTEVLRWRRAWSLALAEEQRNRGAWFEVLCGACAVPAVPTRVPKVRFLVSSQDG